jgi:hypothetical protein
VFDEICGKAGYHRLPLADSPAPGLPWKVIRKVFRLTILPALTGLASFAGDGESIHAVLGKVSPGDNGVKSNAQLRQTRRFC